jgi:probable H4MPT-linked C1 transfer pathway protein
MKWLALDIGGANLKIADGEGYAAAYSFSMWRDSAGLTQQIRTLISEAPQSNHLAVTMTGELADCFENKVAGVRFILNAVREGSDNRHSRIYLCDGRLVTPQVAVTLPSLVAAANWHALAQFAGRFAEGAPALLVDVGSTTCDIIPIVGGKPAAAGISDTQRMVAGELVYTGVERSPVCAVAREINYRGQTCPLVQELFATMRDVYTVLEQIPEDAASHLTADGRPAVKAASRARLARMISADTDEFNHRDAVALARDVADAQAELLARAIERVRDTMAQPAAELILSGHGEFLARAALERLRLDLPVTSLTRELGPAISRSATAHALAVLAREAMSQ